MARNECGDTLQLNMESRLISIKTFAEMFGFSVSYTKHKWPEWCVKYSIRTKKIGKARRFYLPDVERAMMKGLE